MTDLCINCKMCASECDAHVDIPRLMLETKRHAPRPTRLASRPTGSPSRLEGLSRWGSNLPLILNFLLSRSGIRWGMEKLFGLFARHRMPRVRPTEFHQGRPPPGLDAEATRRHGAEAKLRVAYFVDTFASYHDIGIAEATVRVLRHQGVEVYVPERQRGSGMAAAMAMGDTDLARKTAWKHLRLFGDPDPRGLRGGLLGADGGDHVPARPSATRRRPRRPPPRRENARAD